MNKKTISIVIVVLLLVFLVLVVSSKNKKPVEEVQNKENIQTDSQVQKTEDSSTVKEFAMTSFVEMIDGKPNPQYSLKEIVVNKGDRVRIKITVTSGMHDFKIDEYDVYADTQLNKESVVEFTADKAGEFIYYCTKPGHRANGHWGTLKVLE